MSCKTPTPTYNYDTVGTRHFSIALCARVIFLVFLKSPILVQSLIEVFHFVLCNIVIVLVIGITILPLSSSISIIVIVVIDQGSVQALTTTRM
jgi:hypothetical protein